MSLKGYEWLLDDKVVMQFTFKREELVVWEKVSPEEEQKFIDWLAEHHCKPFKIIRWYERDSD